MTSTVRVHRTGRMTVALTAVIAAPQEARHITAGT
jgi:hypothetical protein